MTTDEIRLADEKMRAEIAKLWMEASDVRERIGRRSTEDEKLRAEISKLIAETTKLNGESRWYLLVVGSGLTLAIATVVKLFF